MVQETAMDLVAMATALTTAMDLVAMATALTTAMVTVVTATAPTMATDLVVTNQANRKMAQTAETTAIQLPQKRQADNQFRFSIKQTYYISLLICSKSVFLSLLRRLLF